MIRSYVIAARNAAETFNRPLAYYVSSSSGATLPTTCRSTTSLTHSGSTFSTSAFQPPPNNTYHGTPVYNHIDIGSKKITDAAAARNEDKDAVFVVTGASRSMGLEFVKQLLKRTKGKIVACILRPGSSPALDDALSQLSRDDRSRVNVLPLDVTNKDQIEHLAKELEAMYGRVDGLFNVAGVLGDKTETAGPEMNLSQLDQSWLQQQFAVNAIGPLMLTSKLAPLLKARRGKTYLRETGSKESVVVNLSARVASISDNTGGLAWYSYRMSKAALNSGVRATSHELQRQGTWTIALYPGMTDTAMSKPFQTKMMKEKGLVFPVEFTVGRLLDVINAMEKDHSGGMFDWAGQAIPF